MADLLSVPLKKPADVDIIKPLKNLISGSFSTADTPEDYSEQIAEFSKLRVAAIWRVFEKYESSLEVIYRYYDQLVALEGKLPVNEVQIPFKWKDAFDKGSIFGAKIRLTLSSLAYERVCVLFNIAALQSAVAASQSIDNDDGLKLAAKLLQQSAGIFNHLKSTVMLAIQQEPTPDLNPDTLNALSALMLAQAQEIFVTKAIQDKMKDAVIAKLCSQTEELYSEVLKMFQKEMLRHLWDKDWIPCVAGKQAAYSGLAHYYQSLVCKAGKQVGEEIARLEHASELLKAAQSRSGKPSFFAEYATKINRNLTDAKKDNDFIYHERIPDVKSLPALGKAMLAKKLPLPERLSANFKDLFEKLCPVAVHQAMATFDIRRGEIVNVEVNKLREASNTLNSTLASLNLPAAIEQTSGSELPQSLVEKGDQVKQAGGLQALEATLNELPELLQRNKDILDEADRMLNEEEQSDQQLRAQFKEKWTRTPSAKLTETLRSNGAKYREIINNAIHADESVRKKFQMHRRGMELLSMSKDAMERAVPSASGREGSVEQSSAVSQLRTLMEDVATIKAERDVIEMELKSAAADMKSTFLRALVDDGAISEAALSTESLGRTYGPLQKQVADSLQRQQALIANIQNAHDQFSRESAGQPSRREGVLKDMAAAYDSYMELSNNLQEGSKFYNDLTQLLVVYQNKISDFCFARKTEKEELMKDLTQAASRQQANKISVPTHITPASATDGAYSTPPPAVPGMAPYPTAGGSYPISMPVPYGAPPATPYPTYVPPPMPQGYNPLFSMPYPPQGNYGYPYQPPPGQYSGYPYPTQNQAPGQPPQNPHGTW